MKEWMKGPFLDISRYEDAAPRPIDIHPGLFNQLFTPQDRESAFLSYIDFYHNSGMTAQDTRYILENFERCVTCEDWFNKDDLECTEQMIGGGIGLTCSDCAHTLG